MVNHGLESKKISNKKTPAFPPCLYLSVLDMPARQMHGSWCNFHMAKPKKGFFIY